MAGRVLQGITFALRLDEQCEVQFYTSMSFLFRMFVIFEFFESP